MPSTKSAPRPRSDGRREQIIDAALKLMISEGLYQATTRKIAAAAQVNVATLHYHFHDKEEILLKVMEQLVANYRRNLARQFSTEQHLLQRIADLLYFIWSEIQSAPGEQLLLQEMTIFLLRNPETEPMAREKDRVFLSLYVDALMASTDVEEHDRPFIVELANFAYTCNIGIFNQWLATRDTPGLLRTLANLVAAVQAAARDRSFCAVPM